MGAKKISYHFPFLRGYKEINSVNTGLPNRYNAFSEYRYGFNGLEKDDEVKGEGNSYTTEFRQYDSRIGRWLSLDPLMAQYPNQSPYVAFNNNPVFYSDIKGKEGEPSTTNENQTTQIQLTNNLYIRIRTDVASSVNIAGNATVIIAGSFDEALNIINGIDPNYTFDNIFVDIHKSEDIIKSKNGSKINLGRKINNNKETSAFQTLFTKVSENGEFVLGACAVTDELALKTGIDILLQNADNIQNGVKVYLNGDLTWVPGYIDYDDTFKFKDGKEKQLSVTVDDGWTVLEKGKSPSLLKEEEGNTGGLLINDKATDSEGFIVIE